MSDITAQLVAALKAIKTTLKNGEPTQAYVIACQTLSMPELAHYETSIADRLPTAP